MPEELFYLHFFFSSILFCLFFDFSIIYFIYKISFSSKINKSVSNLTDLPTIAINSKVLTLQKNDLNKINKVLLNPLKKNSLKTSQSTLNTNWMILSTHKLIIRNILTLDYSLNRVLSSTILKNLYLKLQCILNWNFIYIS